jgi:hypothetical protein
MFKFRLSAEETKAFDNGSLKELVRSNSSLLQTQLQEVGIPVYARPRGVTYWDYHIRPPLPVMVSRFGNRVRSFVYLHAVFYEYKAKTEGEPMKYSWRFVVSVAKDYNPEQEEK